MIFEIIRGGGGKLTGWGKNGPAYFFPGERMGRPILSPGKKLTGGKFRPVTPGQLWNLIVSIPDLCRIPYFYRHFGGTYSMSVTSHHHRSFFVCLNNESSDKNVNMQVLSIVFAAECSIYNKYPKSMYWRNYLAQLEFWLYKNGSRFFFLSLCTV